MKCVNCGNDIPDKARFCPYCGTQNEPQQETTQNGQTNGQYQYQQPGEEAPRQANTVNLDSSLILKIGTAILGLIYVIFALRYVFNGVRTLLSVFSWGYATSIPGAVLTLISLLWRHGSASGVYRIFKTAGKGKILVYSSWDSWDCDYWNCLSSDASVSGFRRRYSVCH